jgi:four helix bundle protein
MPDKLVRLIKIITERLIMNYKDLEVWQIARELSIEIHKLTLSFPKFEMYEEGSQIRRSSKSIRSNIVEGYGRRRYKNEFIRYIVFAIASTDETIDHLEILMETESLKDKILFKKLSDKANLLDRKLINFLKFVEEKHISEK